MSDSNLFHSSSAGDFLFNLEKIKKEIYQTKSFDISQLKSLPPETLDKTLVEWRNEQLQKVEEELHLLMVIEDMIKSSDAQSFEGYTDEKKFAQMIKNARHVN